MRSTRDAHTNNHPSAGRILVVEDHHDVRSAITDLLALVDYEVTVAESLAEAVDVVDRVDVVLLDLHLPDGNGLELLGLVGELTTPPEVIVTTGHGTADYAIQALHAGASAFLTKPVQADDLLMMVGRAIQRRRAARDLELHRKLLRSVPAVVLAVDDNDRLTWLNHRAELALGVDSLGARGRPIAEFVSPAPLRVDTPWNEEFRYFSAHGRAGTFLGGWQELDADGDDPSRRVLWGRDVTELRKGDGETIFAAARAEAGALVQRSIFDTMHFLSGAVANTSVLRADLDLDPPDLEAVRQAADDSLEATNRAMEVLRHLRESFRTQADEPEAVHDMGELVRAACAAVGRPEWTETRWKVEIQVQVGPDVRVRGRRGDLVSMVSRMVMSTRAPLRDQAWPRPVLQVEVRADDCDVLVDIQHNGPDLDPDEVACLFELPETAEDADRRLAMARSLASAHGGTLGHVQGTDGVRLRLRLPRAWEDSEEPDQSS